MQNQGTYNSLLSTSLTVYQIDSSLVVAPHWHCVECPVSALLNWTQNYPIWTRLAEWSLTNVENRRLDQSWPLEHTPYTKARGCSHRDYLKGVVWTFCNLSSAGTAKSTKETQWPFLIYYVLCRTTVFFMIFSSFRECWMKILNMWLDLIGFFKKLKQGVIIVLQADSENLEKVGPP